MATPLLPSLFVFLIWRAFSYTSLLWGWPFIMKAWTSCSSMSMSLHVHCAANTLNMSRRWIWTRATRKSSGLDLLAKWLESLIANVKVALVLGSTPTSSNTVESERRQMKQCWIQKSQKSYIILIKESHNNTEQFIKRGSRQQRVMAWQLMLFFF